jgi:hypothetical protein
VQLSENDCKSSRLEAKDQYFLQLQEILARGLRGQLDSQFRSGTINIVRLFSFLIQNSKLRIQNCV